MVKVKITFHMFDEEKDENFDIEHIEKIREQEVDLIDEWVGDLMWGYETDTQFIDMWDYEIIK